LNKSEAFLKASSFPPATRRALKDCTDGMEGGIDIEDEARISFGSVETDEGSVGEAEGMMAGPEEVDAAYRVRTSLASVISPSAMLRVL
jgi:hypothetical protein